MLVFRWLSLAEVTGCLERQELCSLFRSSGNGSQQAGFGAACTAGRDSEMERGAQAVSRTNGPSAAADARAPSEPYFLFLKISREKAQCTHSKENSAGK